MSEKSEIVKSRLREICPLQKLSEMDVIEVEKSCHIAFEIIGYETKRFVASFEEVWRISDAEYLCDYIYCVWRCDNGI